MQFAAADIEGCAAASATAGASLNPFDFRLQMPDNTRLSATPGWREPSLNATTLVAGDCVRGWVTFEVPVGQLPATVNFETTDRDLRPVVMKWTVN